MRAFVVAVALLAVTVPTASAASSWCSPTGDSCTQVYKRDGVQRLELRTFSYRGKVKICVTPPAGSRACRSFTLRRGKFDIYSVNARWSLHFPNHGRGTYRVAYFLDGDTKYGPTLTFRR